MQIDEWLKASKEDAVKRRLPELVPLLEGLASSTSALRSADDAQRMRAEPGRAPSRRDTNRMCLCSSQLTAHSSQLTADS